MTATDSPLHLYAGIGTRIAESRDGGKTWTMQPGPPAETIQLAVDPAGVVYAGTVQGLAKRAPDGAWHTLPLPAGNGGLRDFRQPRAAESGRGG